MIKSNKLGLPSGDQKEKNTTSTNPSKLYTYKNKNDGKIWFELNCDRRATRSSDTRNNPVKNRSNLDVRNISIPKGNSLPK